MAGLQALPVVGVGSMHWLADTRNRVDHHLPGCNALRVPIARGKRGGCVLRKHTHGVGAGRRH